MRAGRLDRRIVIERPVSTTDTFGASIQTWTEVATVWASVRQLRGQEYLSAQAGQAEVDAVFKLRYRADLTPVMRITYGGANYDIKSISEIGRREALEIMARAQVE